MAAEKKIEGELYRVDPMPAREAIELLADISRVASQATGRLPSIIDALAGSDADGDGLSQLADVAALAGLGDILRANSSADLAKLVERIVGAAKVKRPSGQFVEVSLDEEFSGKLEAIIPVARFVLETTFGPFFAASRGAGLLKNLRAAFGGTR